MAVVDCGLGNVAAVANMLRRAGAAPVLTADPAVVAASSAVVLPGIGSFDAGVARLRATGMWEALLAYAPTGRPMLGVCLGMQMLAAGSEEGQEPGLGLVDAHFRRFSAPGLKVPHTGWNTIRTPITSELFDGADPDERRYYFVHSYYAVPGPDAEVLAVADYEGEFACAYRQGNRLGVQFHPEKSHRFGLTLMRRFVVHAATGDAVAGDPVGESARSA